MNAGTITEFAHQLTVADARLTGRNLEKYKATVADPVAKVDAVAFAQLRIRTLTEVLHGAAFAMNERFDAHHLAVAEDAARGSYTSAVLRERDLFRLKNLRDFVEADIVNEQVTYVYFDRAQTRHHAVVVRDLVSAEIDRRQR